MKWCLKYLTLKCFDEINLHQKKEVDIAHDDSRFETTSNISVVNSLHGSVNDLPYLGQAQVAVKSNLHYGLHDKLRNTIDNLDMDDPRTEITELRNLYTILANKVRLNKSIRDILVANGESVSPEMVRADSDQNASLAENKILTNKMLGHVRADEAIFQELSKKPIQSIDQIRALKSGSLVEDYANPSLEMPSYMDPED